MMMNDRDYPIERCTTPPLKSKVIRTCAENCKSTVTFINDMSSDMAGREKLVEMLEPDHEIVLFNNRGHFNVSKNRFGRIVQEGDDGTTNVITDYMPDPKKCKEIHGIEPYTLDFLVEDTKRILDDHGIEKTDIVGFSLGSFIGQKFAAKYPERVGKLAIGKAFTKYHDPIQQAKGIMSGPVFKVFYWLWCTSRGDGRGEREYGCNVPLDIVDEYAKQVINSDLTKDQLKIESPTLVIECTDDAIFGTPVQHIKNMKKSKVDGCGHVLYNNSDKMYSAVKEFLSD